MVNSRSFVNQYKDAWICASHSVFITTDTGGIFPKIIIDFLVFWGSYADFFFQQIILFSISRYHSVVHVDFRKKIWITEYFSNYYISVGVIATQMSFNNGKRNQTKQNKRFEFQSVMIFQLGQIKKVIKSKF